MRRFVVGLALCAACLVTPAVAGAYSTSPDFKATDFVTGFPSHCCTTGGAYGPIGLAWDATRHLYVADPANGIIYRFDASGGTAAGHELNAGAPYSGTSNATGLTFSRGGRLYLALQTSGEVVEIDPATGRQLRVVAHASCATGIATDPLSGDLIVTDPCPGPATRVFHPDSASPTWQTLAYPTWADGITFAPDGTIYSTYYGSTLVRGAPTSSPLWNSGKGLTSLTTAGGLDGTALELNADGSVKAIVMNLNGGKVISFDPATRQTTTIFSGGTRGDFTTVGPDGCLYITQTDRIVRITDANGGCPFVPTTALPVLNASPATQTPHVGQTATVSATLSNVADPAGQTVTFTVTGANPQTLTAVADASGVTTVSYKGTAQGIDTVLAQASVGGVTVDSSAVQVDWLAPLDRTPPVIVATVDGTLGNDGWYVSPATVSFAVSDPETGIATTSGCETVTLTADTPGVPVTCTATNGVGLTASDTETVKIDATAPVVTYAGNAGTYDVNQSVAITCSPVDALSGVVSNTCAGVAGPAWSFGVGTHTLSATATDDAGNVGKADTTFTVVVTADGLCDLVDQWSAKQGVASSLCSKLSSAVAARARGTDGAAQNILDAFRNEVAAQRGKALSEANADELTLLSESV